MQRRPLVLVAVALVAAGTVAALAARSGEDLPESSTAIVTVAPLPGLPLVALPETAPEPMSEGAQALVDGDRAAAVAAFERARSQGVEGADIALVVASYDGGTPDAAIARLRLLAPTSAFARYELGVLLVWAGRLTEATGELRAVRDAAPESFYGVRADDLLHPTMQSGYPLFVPAAEPAAGITLADLEAAVRARPDDVAALLQLGASLQASGRRGEAVEVYRRAVRADPTSVEAQVALAVGGFSKDEPAAAFGAVGPLVRDNAGDPVPRFHLAMMLVWLGDRDRATAEFRQVAAEAPGTRLARLAVLFEPR